MRMSIHDPDDGWIVLTDDTDALMRFEQVEDARIFRPRTITEFQIRQDAEAHLRSRYDVGQYAGAAEVNDILHHVFAYYEESLSTSLPQIASVSLLNFLLYQYDESAKVESLRKGAQLQEEELGWWRPLGPIFRRAIKYLAERVIMLDPPEDTNLPGESAIRELEKAWVSAEQIITLCNLSDQTYYIFPDETVCEVFPVGNQVYFSLSVPDFNPEKIDGRTLKDTQNRSRFVPHRSFDRDSTEHDRSLADSFRQTVGISYEETLSVLYRLIEDAKPPKKGFPVPFGKKENIIGSVSKSLGYEIGSVEQAISGFMLTRDNILTENEPVWNPKREFRAFRRGFFQTTYEGEPHLFWSREMAKECWMQLLASTCFKHVPPEWSSAVVENALETLSNRGGKWFEELVTNHLHGLGIIGTSFKNGIGVGASRIRIPDDVGEMDFLGYSDANNALVLLECKMVCHSVEHRQFRDDLEDFVRKKRGYANKFRKKIAWVNQNLAPICRALPSSLNYRHEISTDSTLPAMITLYPSIATLYIDDFPCASITELMTGYKEAGGWPY